MNDRLKYPRISWGYFFCTLVIAFLASCANQTTNEAVPSSEDTAVFNPHVENWKTAISGFSSEEPEKVMRIFADSLKCSLKCTPGILVGILLKGPLYSRGA